MLKTFAAAAVALATFASPALAQEPRGAAMVTRLLDATASEIGLTAGARTTGRLSQNGVQTATLAAPAGTVYFIGVCDEGCSDVDLIVRDPSGREVGRDFELDDVPVVAVQQGAAGAYTVEVSMASCTGSCNWGVGVFR